MLELYTPLFFCVVEGGGHERDDGFQAQVCLRHAARRRTEQYY